MLDYVSLLSSITSSVLIQLLWIEIEEVKTLLGKTEEKSWFRFAEQPWMYQHRAVQMQP